MICLWLLMGRQCFRNNSAAKELLLDWVASLSDVPSLHQDLENDLQSNAFRNWWQGFRNGPEAKRLLSDSVGSFSDLPRSNGTWRKPYEATTFGLGGKAFGLGPMQKSTEKNVWKKQLSDWGVGFRIVSDWLPWASHWKKMLRAPIFGLVHR